VSRESDSVSYVVSPRLWSWLGAQRTIAALLWLSTFGVCGFFLWHALIWFDSPSSTPVERRRMDGNGGHVQIDFGGQWLMGRMIVCGHARELYHRQAQWEVAQASFRVEDEDPVTRSETIVPGPLRNNAKPEDDLKHDADRMMGWFMGYDSREWRKVGGAVVAPLAGQPLCNPLFTAALQHASNDTLTPTVMETVTTPAIGGPLYPPVHAFLYAPLGAIDSPQRAYRVFQVIATAFVFLAGLGVKVLTRGRIWWSVATLALFLYPGTRGGMDLGQNPTITLTIAIWGWVLAARGYNIAGGVVWGLFAFKPVWGLAFFLVPLLTGRWRFCVAMVATGIGLAAATLPFVGLQTWLDWLTVGNDASALYNVNKNWINLSRDLQGIPRRILHNFSLPEAERDTRLAKVLAWSLWGTVLATTIGIYLRFGDRKRATGTTIGFLFFSAYLVCYRFMYYDALLSAVGFAVLFAEPGRFFRTRVFGIAQAVQTPTIGNARELNPPRKTSNPLSSQFVGYINSFPLTILVLLMALENSFSGMELQGTLAFGYYARATTGADGVTNITTPKLVADSGVNYPTETFLILLVWMWCGYRLIRGDERDGHHDSPSPPIPLPEGE
jgi:arabinofuranan 3-O-arabinosyltransferase